MDALIILLKPPIDVQGLAAGITARMPEDGDTSIEDIRGALQEHGLVLEVVNIKYMKKGGASFYLFEETNCRLIIRLKLTNLRNETMFHFVAWDGEVVYDKPYDNIIDREIDLASKEASTMAFGRLYPKTEFISWQITSVYSVVHTQP